MKTSSNFEKLQNEKLRSQIINQLKTTKKIKEKSKGHSLLILKREAIIRVNSTSDLAHTSSPKFVQITKVKIP